MMRVKGLAWLIVLGMCPMAAAATVALTPVADAFVTTGPSGNLSGNNYGGAGALMVAASALGKGEFRTVVRFDTSSIKTSFDAEYGEGNWQITSITLRNAGNFGTAGTQPNNAIFPVIAAGNFSISWMQNDSWAEGTGNPMSSVSDGVTYTSLPTFQSANDKLLGTYMWDAPGSNIQRTWDLGLNASLIADLSSGAGSLTSFLYAPADSAVGFLFNARTFGTSGNVPLLTVTAVPEPQLFSLALFGLAMLRRRRTR